MKPEETMTVKPGLEQEYENYVDKNQDSYGNGVILAGHLVGQALDEGKTCEESENAMHGFGITGFMAGCVASSIKHFHPRGDEFNEYWNNQFGSSSKDGTVNPAILTIKTKDDEEKGD